MSVIGATRIGQRGVALITVLLVLALATVTVVSISTERQADIRRTENLLRGDQAWVWVQGLEDVAKSRLADDDQKSWRKRLYREEIGAAELQGTIADQQGLLNLNNLLHDGEVSELDVMRFKRLLGHLQLKPELTDALLDWLDDDSAIRYPSGAEDELYTGKHPAYRAANRTFADVSELLLVHGVTHDVYRKLLPFVYAAPGYAELNVNVAKPEILRCLADDVSTAQAESMFRAGGKPFDEIEDFLQDEAVAGLNIDKKGLTIRSEYFLLSGRIAIGRQRMRFASQLRKLHGGKTQVLRRARLGWEYG